MFGNIDIRQEAKDEGDKVEKELTISHKPHQMRVQIDHFIYQFIPNPNKSYMFAFVGVDQSNELLHSILILGLEFDVHGQFGKSDKNFF